jgi:hypothetical protein
MENLNMNTHCEEQPIQSGAQLRDSFISYAPTMLLAIAALGTMALALFMISSILGDLGDPMLKVIPSLAVLFGIVGLICTVMMALWAFMVQKPTAAPAKP